jgi:hypothetical protein
MAEGDVALLSKKIGPLPGWAWGGIGTLGVGALVWWQKRKAAAAAQAANPASASDTVPTLPTTADLAAAGLYSPPPYVIAGNIAGPIGETGATGATGAQGATGPPSVAVPPPPPPPAPAPPAPPPAATIAPPAPAPPAPRYVTVTRWPSVDSTLSGIAASHGISLARIEQLNPQYSKNWNLLYTGESVRIS